MCCWRRGEQERAGKKHEVFAKKCSVMIRSAIRTRWIDQSRVWAARRNVSAVKVTSASFFWKKKKKNAKWDVEFIVMICYRTKDACVSSRTLKCTSRPPWTSIRSTTPWSCLPSTTTPASWQHSTKSVIPLWRKLYRNQNVCPLEGRQVKTSRLRSDSNALCPSAHRHVVDSSTTTPSPGWLSRPANLLSCWPDTAIPYWRRGGWHVCTWRTDAVICRNLRSSSTQDHKCLHPATAVKDQ